MSRTFHHGERRIRVTGVQRKQPDTRRIARAIIALALAQDEADAKAEFERRKTPTSRRSSSGAEKSREIETGGAS
jgi:hypothetical protein